MLSCASQPADLIDPWGTVGAIRSVLMVGRTIQATARLLFDVMPLVEADTRIQVYFTVDESTQFGDQVPRFLDAHGAKLIPWNHVVSGAFDCDVTITASANENLHRLPGKKIVMAHGAGYHKYRAEEVGAESAVAGLSPHQLLVDGEVHPHAVILAGVEQRDRLRTDCPEAESRAVVAGDVCAQRLHASLPHRDRYRRALSVGPDERLVVLTSTWRHGALLNQCPKLPESLLERLPAGGYKVAFVLHPNGWDRHGRPQVHGWLRRARRAGLIMIPPHEGWRAALVAADCVIGDQGSVGFYAADIDRPLLYGTFRETEIPPESPAAQLAAAAPFLDAEADLAEQIETAIRSHHPGRYRDITTPALDPDVNAADALRDIIYRLMNLEATEPTEVAPVSLPQPVVTPPSAWLVDIIEGTDGPWLERYPVTTARFQRTSPGQARLLVCDAAEPDGQLPFAAPVHVWTEDQMSSTEARQWTRDRLDSFPGTQVALAAVRPNGFLIRARGTESFVVAGDDAGVTPTAIGAALCHRLRSGHRIGAVAWTESGRRHRIVPTPLTVAQD